MHMHMNRHTHVHTPAWIMQDTLTYCLLTYFLLTSYLLIHACMHVHIHADKHVTLLFSLPYLIEHACTCTQPCMHAHTLTDREHTHMAGSLCTRN